MCVSQLGDFITSRFSRVSFLNKWSAFSLFKHQNAVSLQHTHIKVGTHQSESELKNNKSFIVNPLATFYCREQNLNTNGDTFTWTEERQVTCKKGQLPGCLSIQPVFFFLVPCIMLIIVFWMSSNSFTFVFFSSICSFRWSMRLWLDLFSCTPTHKKGK